MTETTESSPKPRRGRPPRMSRAKIIAAARGIEPEDLTIQGLADQLGVHRNVVNYHISDRETLLGLVAADRLRESFDRLEFSTEFGWQVALRAFGVAMRDDAVAAGSILLYAHFTGPDELKSLGPAEQVLHLLRDAGFDLATAARAINGVTKLSLGNARDLVMIQRSGAHPQALELQEVLHWQEADGLGALRELLESGVDTQTPDQLDFDLDVFIAGLERLLETREQTALAR